jgi:lysophospholipase L1-like esterase
MRKATGLCAAFLLAALSSPPIADPAAAQSGAAAAPACEAPAEFTRLEHPLQRTALNLVTGKPIKIVAIGSSSTAGAGASSPAKSYPSRLEADLRARFPGIAITVVNRGVNGEEAKQMLARFDAVLADKPDLVLWQVGTNAVLREHSLVGAASLIREGIARLRAAEADVVLIDAQYAPKVLAKPDAPGMVALIGAAARDARVSIFHRWEIMRKWHEVDRLPFAAVLAPDGLHMNDWSYGCIARLLAVAIADAARGPTMARGRTR